jgi:glycosyltransferase involved in cell wall biosynthesis
MPRVPFSVVIPAHNEAAVIGRCLRALLQDAPADSVPEIIVVCNGCTDDTAAQARAVSDAITVIELSQGSKPLALNTGNSMAVAMPRFFVDADVITRYSDLAAVAERLDDGRTLAAAPRLFVDTSKASRAVQGYYRVWCALPYVRNAMIGSGVFGLSATGLSRIDRFPDIISDDGYVRSRFSAEERCGLEKDALGRPVTFTVFPPRTLRSLLSVEIRRRAGTDELQRKGYASRGARDNGLRQIVASRSETAGWDDIAVYLFVKIWTRLVPRLRRLTGGSMLWNRDETSRTTA